MNKEQILNLFTDDVEARRAMVAAYLADHTNPYEDRKEVFMNTPEHLYTEEPWIMSLPEYEDKFGEISWYDDFYIERHSLVDLTGICQDVESGLMSNRIKSPQDFVKAIVNSGVHSFTMDW